MFRRFFHPLHAGRVRAHRQWIAQNRCPKRPGLTHHWEEDYVFDPSSFGSVIQFWSCSKCGESDGL